MICDTLQHLGRYRGLHPNLDTAIDYLLTHDLAAMPLGRTEVDGDKVVEQNNFRAVFTATRLSFWQDATEVAYVSNNRLYITNITVLGGIDVGQWSMEAAEGGLAFRWIGG